MTNKASNKGFKYAIISLILLAFTLVILANAYDIIKVFFEN
ncbi:hypothetical protein [Flavobacterium sp. 3HN19-14]